MENPTATADSTGISNRRRICNINKLNDQYRIYQSYHQRTGITHEYFGGMMIENQKRNKASCQCKSK